MLPLGCASFRKGALCQELHRSPERTSSVQMPKSVRSPKQQLTPPKALSSCRMLQALGRMKGVWISLVQSAIAHPSPHLKRVRQAETEFWAPFPWVYPFDTCPSSTGHLHIFVSGDTKSPDCPGNKLNPKFIASEQSTRLRWYSTFS